MKDVALLRLEDIAVGYGGNALLSGVSAAVSAGELVAIIGSNGAGKSTLLRSVEGSLPLIGGKIEIDGIPVAELSQRQLAGKIAVVNTQRPDTQMLTAREIVELGRYPHTGFWGRLSRDDRHIVGRAMELTGTAAFASRRFLSLSDGERQKVMIARTIAQQTPLILLDEPTSFLDVANRIEIMSLLRELAASERRAMVMSSHDIPSSLEMADRLWLIFPSGDFGEYRPADLLSGYDSADPSHPLNRVFAGRPIAFSPSRLNYTKK